MCGGGDGGDGGDSSSETRPGEEQFNPNAPQGSQGGEAQTYRSATSTLGGWVGDNRSDQQMADDDAYNRAMDRRGSYDETTSFTNSRGQNVSLASYGLAGGGPRAGAAGSTGLFGALNSAPTIGGIAGTAASRLIGGPVGFVAGQAVRMGVNTLLGDRSSLGGR